MKLHTMAWILTSILLLGADASKDEAIKKELAQAEGVWAIVSIELEGEKLPEEVLKGAQITIKGTSYGMKLGDGMESGSFKIDPAAKPKSMDILPAEGPHKGQTLLAIYEVNGDDLKMCIALPGKDRPKEFVSKAGSGHVLEILKRQKK